MRKKYEWCIPPSSEEIEAAWSGGVLTVDANVLLDLYRYHTQTREDLLKAIEGFKERIWISDQSAQEFIRNRNAVIAAAEKTFLDAAKGLDDLAAAVDNTINVLRGHRLVPRYTIDTLRTNLLEAVKIAKEEIAKSQKEHPNFFKTDPILERIFTLFEGRVGPSPTDEERGTLAEEAEKRRLAKVPPGYLDNDKDGDRPYGDFFLWRQVLIQARDGGHPVILVSSERKEDWWEKHSGKHIGPRPELLKEASEFAKQRVYLYQTDHFLELAAKKSGTPVNANTLDEIRELMSAKRSAVQVSQDVSHADETENRGILTIHLVRPLFGFTGSGALDPNMSKPPGVTTRVISIPDNTPSYSVRGGTGTSFDFNVHVRSTEHGAMLPVGNYVIEYTASCKEDAISDKDNVEDINTSSLLTRPERSQWIASRNSS